MNKLIILLKHTMQSKLIVPLIVGALVVGGGSFYGGMLYGKTNVAQAAGRAGQTGAFAGGQGRGGAGGPGGAGGFTAGEVLSKDANTLTIKMRDGSSKIVMYSSSTKVGKIADGSLADVIQGTQVTVTGTPNSDGSVNASMLQIRPAMAAPAPDATK